MTSAGLGPGMASSYYESYEQEHQKWPWPAWDPEWPVSITNLISRSTRSGLGRPGVWNGQFLLRILLAGAPEVALAGLGPGMASFYYESYEQEHQKWPRPAWGRISPFWYYGVQ